jgi:hypothetical protein
MITPATVVSRLADYIEFRTPTTFGCQVVRVYTGLPIPRVTAWSEWVTDGDRVHNPLSLMLDEILEFCAVAWATAEKPAMSWESLLPSSKG